MAILSKECKPDHFESHNSLKLSFEIFVAFVQMLININFLVDFFLSLNQTLLVFWLYVRQTWITQLILAISLTGYLPLI